MCGIRRELGTFPAKASTESVGAAARRYFELLKKRAMKISRGGGTVPTPSARSFRYIREDNEGMGSRVYCCAAVREDAS